MRHRGDVAIDVGDHRLRREAAAMAGYFWVYLAYLFIHPENELWHWVSLVLLPVLVLLGLRKARRHPAALVAILRDVGLFNRPRWTTSVVALVIAGLSVWLQLHGRRSADIRQTFMSGEAVYLLPLSFLLSVATAATTEEFFFRGLLQSRVHRATGSAWFAILLSTLAFAAFHVPYAYTRPGWGVMGQVGPAVVAAAETGVPYGLILGLLYARSGNSLPLVIATHALVNATPGMIIVKRLLSAG
jgi:membrane protease YdiL (CAAX protease family)